MKKLIPMLVAVAVFAIGGCSKFISVDERPIMVDLRSKTTATEYAILKEFYATHGNFQSYKLLLANVQKRTVVPDQNTPPFCSEIMFLIPNDYHGDEHDIHYQVTSYYPNIKTDCLMGAPTVTKVPEPGTTAIPTVSLSLDSIEELIEAAKSCNTAKVIIISRENLGTMSEEEASSIIKQCRIDKLREELNK